MWLCLQKGRRCCFLRHQWNASALLELSLFTSRRLQSSFLLHYRHWWSRTALLTAWPPKRQCQSLLLLNSRCKNAQNLSFLPSHCTHAWHSSQSLSKPLLTAPQKYKCTLKQLILHPRAYDTWYDFFLFFSEYYFPSRACTCPVNSFYSLLTFTSCILLNTPSVNLLSAASHAQFKCMICTLLKTKWVKCI